MKDENENYAALRERIHEALAAEHPEWIEADGGSPMLDLYDARFAELLTKLQSPTDRETAVQPTLQENTPLPRRGITPRMSRLKRT